MLTGVIICRLSFVGESFAPVAFATKLDICPPHHTQRTKFNWKNIESHNTSLTTQDNEKAQ